MRFLYSSHISPCLTMPTLLFEADSSYLWYSPININVNIRINYQLSFTLKNVEFNIRNYWYILLLNKYAWTRTENFLAKLRRKPARLLALHNIPLICCQQQQRHCLVNSYNTIDGSFPVRTKIEHNKMISRIWSNAHPPNLKFILYCLNPESRIWLCKSAVR